MKMKSSVISRLSPALKVLAFLALLDYLSLPVAWCLLILLGIYFIWYLSVCERPSIHTGNAQLRKIAQSLPCLGKRFYPSPLYFEGRLQTIAGLKKRSSDRIQYTREILKLKDGGKLGLDFINNKDGSNQTVLLLPGLTSSSQTSYVKSLVKAILKAGCNCIVYNTRGLAGVELVTPRWACAANCDDLLEVTEYIRSKEGSKEKLFVVGASFGGMLLCQLLLNHPATAKSAFSGCLALSAVFDMSALLKSLDKPYFNKYVLNQGVTLDILYRAKKFPSVMNSRPDKWDFQHASQAKTLSELDERLTCPMFGYESKEEYYEKATTVHRLGSIPIPMFVLNSLDDPMQPGYSLPLYETSQNAQTNVVFITTKRGGHLGFIEGVFSKEEHFMERFTCELIKTFFKIKRMSG